MDTKENTMVSNLTGYTVKNEPREVTLPSCSHATESTRPVKAEPTDNARVFLDRGLPIPSYVQGGITRSPLSRTNSENVLPKTEDGVPLQQGDLNLQEQPLAKPTHFTVYNSSGDIAFTPEAAFNEGMGMVKVVKDNLKKLELGSKLRREVWDREIANLEGECAPKTLIAVCGATGAGKSSILNAVLDDNIVPTSGMRACTAVVTEISYHKKSTIDADISFLSEIEWRQELAVLLHDIVDEDGKIKRVTDLKSDAGVAWQKVHAVYPKITEEALVKMSATDIINYDAAVSRILGATKTISSKDSKAFAKEIGKYIDSKDQKRGKKDKEKKDKEKAKEPSLMDKVRNAAGMASRSTATTTSKPKEADLDAPALWPLIRQVNVRCNAEALSTGAVLVDLPGVADANAARNNIAKDYMKKCNCIWILAPITRAVDDKTARDLLGDAFKMQLMNGNYDDHAITFIASKCDDISCSEVIRALRLEDDPVLEEIEERVLTLRQDISECKKRKGKAEKEVKAITEVLEGIREQQKNHEAHLKALEDGESFTPASAKPTNGKKRKNKWGDKQGSRKRQRSDYQDDSIDDDDDDDSNSSEESDSDSESDSEDVTSDRSDAEAEDQVESMEPVTEESLKAKIKECKDAVKAARATNNEARLRKKEAGDALSTLEKTLIKVQKEKNAFCSLKRSEFSRDVLKEDFRTGLKDLDDAAAEERDPDNFDPSRNLRNYDAIDLPVFTCSSRDYVRLKEQVKGDGEPSCFSNKQDTGIPDLQKWCHQLTIASRERAARTFFAHLKTFAHSIHTYVTGIGDVTAIDRESLREKWESRGLNEPARDEYEEDDPLAAILGGLGAGLGAGLFNMNKQAIKADSDGQPNGITHKLCTEFAILVDQCVQDLQQHFKDGLEEKCRIGAINASDAALSTVDEFSGSMHWATYRATLRRHGSFRRDLNVELINPFTRNIAHSWSQVFESDLFGEFEKATIETINELVKKLEDTAAAGLKDRARLQGETCVEEARVALNKTVDLVKETMTTEQKEISRCMAPHVQAQLIDGYDRAMEERGTGSVARQKAYMRGYVDESKGAMFDDGADVVLDRLTKAAEAIGETLDDAMGKLAEKVEVSMAVLWEGARDNPQQLRARAETIKVVESIQQQIQFWTEAEKLAYAAKRYINDMDED